LFSRPWLAERAAENRRKIYGAAADKPLVDQFYSLQDEGRTEAIPPELRTAGLRLQQFTETALTLRTIGRNTGNMADADASMNHYVADLDADPLVRRYVEFIKSRGNVAKAYKPSMSARLNSLFTIPPSHVQTSREWYDRDNPVIEWTTDGRIVSLLVHAHQANAALGVVLVRYSTLLFGPAPCGHVLNQVRNSEFADLELRTL
jgi:hypothetical protein